MIIINNGIPKSGTSLIEEFLLQLLNQETPENGITVWKKLNKGHFFVPSLTNSLIEVVNNINTQYGSLIIKSHQPCNSIMNNFVITNNVKILCCYRDPRDIMLSAIDHGIRSRNGLDKSGAFKEIYDLDDAIKKVKGWIKIYYSLLNCKNVFFIKYEELVVNQPVVFNQVASFLNIKASYEEITSIHKKIEKTKSKMWNFNKGTTERWRIEMTEKQKEKYSSLLASDIVKMGYSLL